MPWLKQSPLRAAPDRRKQTREPVCLEVSIRIGVLSLPAVATDISINGFSARISQRLPQGTHLRLVHEGLGEISARVIWSISTEVGCQFEVPLDQRDLNMVLAQCSMSMNGDELVAYLQNEAG